MRRKRKKTLNANPGSGLEKREASFNKAFQSLLKDHGEIGKGPEPEPPSSTPIERRQEESEESLFFTAMEGVAPLRNTKDKIVKSPTRKVKLQNQTTDHHERTREYLLSLMKEPGVWDISFSDEYMEGSVAGVGPKTLKRLKRGNFSIQEYIDLHGLTKKEAESAVNDFILESYQKDLRCVLIIHGRGLGSVDFQPAIKRELPVWFRRGVLKRIVLAFVTARPCDGGAGALYVLLRKR